MRGIRTYLRDSQMSQGHLVWVLCSHLPLCVTLQPSRGASQLMHICMQSRASLFHSMGTQGPQTSGRLASQQHFTSVSALCSQEAVSACMHTHIRVRKTVRVRALALVLSSMRLVVAGIHMGKSVSFQG